MKKLPKSDARYSEPKNIIWYLGLVYKGAIRQVQCWAAPERLKTLPGLACSHSCPPGARNPDTREAEFSRISAFFLLCLFTFLLYLYGIGSSAVEREIDPRCDLHIRQR